MLAKQRKKRPDTRPPMLFFHNHNLTNLRGQEQQIFSKILLRIGFAPRALERMNFPDGNRQEMLTWNLEIIASRRSTLRFRNDDLSCLLPFSISLDNLFPIFFLSAIRMRRLHKSFQHVLWPLLPRHVLLPSSLFFPSRCVLLLYNMVYAWYLAMFFCSCPSLLAICSCNDHLLFPSCHVHLVALTLAIMPRIDAF